MTGLLIFLKKLKQLVYIIDINTYYNTHHKTQRISIILCTKFTQMLQPT